MECYLAFTAAELAGCEVKPKKFAWMACHFSSYATGLSNLPENLPEGSILILNDRTPIFGHDPVRILQDLTGIHQHSPLRGVLLDFQTDSPALTELTRFLTGELPCPVAATEAYAKDADCAVFLSPPTVNLSLERYIAPWKGRKLWLEASMLAQVFTVTEDGCTVETLQTPQDDLPFAHERLCCHYSLQKQDRAMVVTIARTKDDFIAQLRQADGLGVELAVGLYQELGCKFLQELVI